MILLFIYRIGDKGYVTEAVYEMSHGVVDLDRQVMLYSCLFVINQVFLSTIYVMLSDRLGEITTFIGMIIREIFQENLPILTTNQVLIQNMSIIILETL